MHAMFPTVWNGPTGVYIGCILSVHLPVCVKNIRNPILLHVKGSRVFPKFTVLKEVYKMIRMGSINHAHMPIQLSNESSLNSSSDTEDDNLIN